jgi:dienelactone hydrolase
VTPRSGLIDKPVSVSVGNLTPDSKVVLTATTLDGRGRRWRSKAVFEADEHGNVIVPASPSLGGSYRGVDGMGLFWSMRLVGSRLPAAEVGFDPARVSRVIVKAVQEGKRTASAVFTRRAASSGVSERRLTVSKNGFAGVLFALRHATTPAAGILFLGSDGGIPNTTAPLLLASHGYPTLALGYFHAPGLPKKLERIPLEYFHHALLWLARRPGVDDKKLIVFGVARGAEAALLLGSVYPHLVHGVVSYVGSSVVGASQADPSKPAWTLKGKPIAHVDGADLGNPEPADDPRAVIPVETISGPIFLVSAATDKVWPSVAYANAIASRLRAHKRNHYTSLVYNDAGHSIGLAVPNIPTATVMPSSHTHLDLGGTPSGNAHARANAWPKLLAYFKNLG